MCVVRGDENKRKNNVKSNLGGVVKVLISSCLLIRQRMTGKSQNTICKAGMITLLSSEGIIALTNFKTPYTEIRKEKEKKKNI
jgi:hypothetical protein